MAFKAENAAYPVGLTNADWQSKKKPAGKLPLKAKTGLGALLVKAETAWKDLDFDKLDAARAGARGLSETLAAKRNAQALLKGAVKKTNKTLNTAAVKADATAKSLLLAKSSRDRAKYIAENLRKRAALLEKIKLDDFDPLIKAAVRDELTAPARTLEADLDDWDRRQSAQQWQAIQHGVTTLATAVRALTQIHKLDTFADQVPAWNKVDHDINMMDPFYRDPAGTGARSAAAPMVYAAREVLGKLTRAF